MVKNIFITGPIGYIGAPLIRFLRTYYPEYNLIGYDTDYFIDDNILDSPENLLNKKIIGDIRTLDENLLKEIDTVIHLAAISNDPISNQFEDITYDINYLASISLAKKAKKMKVKNFIFASSCSVYGFAESGEVTEDSETNPLTPYAKSKLLTEKELKNLADNDFKITCFRFATACGMSDRLRLDLVLNDFVAFAFLNKKIEILSDGTPWRPLIDVIDMARAISWAIIRDGEEYLVLNAGNNNGNYQVKELAQLIQQYIPETKIETNPNAFPDKRSYKVNFDKFNNYDFKKSNLIRLNKINYLKNNKLIDNNLKWII